MYIYILTIIGKNIKWEKYIFPKKYLGKKYKMFSTTKPFILLKLGFVFLN